MKLIIQSDDFGLSHGFSDAAATIFKTGVLTTSSIIVTGKAYSYSRGLLKNQLEKKSLGIHIDLTNGPFLTGYLIKNRGKYFLSYLEYCLRLIFRDRNLLKKIETEVDAQITKVLRDGLTIDHINGHNHIHMIPPIFEIFCKAAIRHGVTKIRIANEPFHKPQRVENFIKFLLMKFFSVWNTTTAKKLKLKFPEAYFSLIHSNNMNFDNTIKCLKLGMAKKIDSIEIAFHPAIPNHPQDKNTHLSEFARWFTNQKERKMELTTLTNKKLKKFIKENKIKLISYKDL